MIFPVRTNTLFRPRYGGHTRPCPPGLARPHTGDDPAGRNAAATPSVETGWRPPTHERVGARTRRQRGNCFLFLVGCSIGRPAISFPNARHDTRHTTKQPHDDRRVNIPSHGGGGRGRGGSLADFLPAPSRRFHRGTTRLEFGKSTDIPGFRPVLTIPRPLRAGQSGKKSHSSPHSPLFMHLVHRTIMHETHCADQDHGHD